MECWNNGKMEEWKYGSMEKMEFWKNGGMEEWRKKILKSWNPGKMFNIQCKM